MSKNCSWNGVEWIKDQNFAFSDNPRQKLWSKTE